MMLGRSSRAAAITIPLGLDLYMPVPEDNPVTPERVELLSSLAPLHDIGKVGVPDRILNKPGVLNVVNGFGVEDRVIASDEPMASLYATVERERRSNVLKL